MTIVLLIPPVLAVLLLAAHFLRAGVLVAVIGLIIIIPFLGLRRRWVPRLFQALLTLGALEWLRTLLRIRELRETFGEPAGRTTAILGGVAVFTLVAAAVFEVPRVRRWYRNRAESGT